jgi:Na+/H+ antiporter NhaD/arsenite permease-like protein
VGLPGIVRDVGLVVVTLASLWLTPRRCMSDNQFGWGPMQEVAKLFAGIFLTIIPVIAMLKAGVNGPFGAIVAAVTRPDGSPDPAMYFWATGALSSFLDNAPTYLVFFNTAGGDPAVLMTTLAPTLAAISAGRRVHGRQHLHRQRAQPHGQGHCRRPGREDAQLLRLHAVVFGILVPLFIGILVPLFIVA